MHLPLSAAVAERLDILEQCGSTNSELVSRASDPELPDFAVLVTDTQTDGRGRLGRSWIAPPGQALAISVLLRPAGRLPIDQYGWLPLIAGLAMTRAVAAMVPSHAVTLKWPNDVQVDGLKISGLLAELLPGGSDVVVGAGLNLSIAAADLPTTTSTSLLLNDPVLPAAELADAALSVYLRELRALYLALLNGESGAVREQVTSNCSTLGERVKVQLPGSGDLVGTASAIDGTGRLVVRRASDRSEVAVAAGDVTHLRYE